MDERKKEIIQLYDEVANVCFYMDQIRSLLTVLSEKYFYDEFKEEEQRKEWGKMSYTGVNALSNAVCDCAANAYKDLVNIREKINEML